MDSLYNTYLKYFIQTFLFPLKIMNFPLLLLINQQSPLCLSQYILT